MFQQPGDPSSGFKRGPLGDAYHRLRGDREDFVDRGEVSAKLTIPSILPDESHTKSQQFKTPFQATGAEGVSNLSSKLMLALFPASSSFFRLRVDESTLSPDDQVVYADEEERGNIDASLGATETKIMEVFEGLAWRPKINQALKSLIVTGNALLYEQDDDLKLFHLNQYVVERDGMGEVVMICTYEKVSLASLDEGTQVAVRFKNAHKKLDPKQDVCAYTCIERLSENKWLWRQEIGGVPTFEEKVKTSELPYIVLTWNRVEGEDYGRGRVEEIIGALQSLEALSESAMRAAAIASKHVLLNGNRSGIAGRRLQTAADGEVISGVNDLDAVRFLNVDKAADLQLILNRIEALENQIQRAFLDFEAVRRNAERVTAEEIRTIALELDRSLGGVYSVLSQHLQLPLVRMLMKRVRLEGFEGQQVEIPDSVSPVIIAGLDALGRGHDFQRVTSFIQAGVSSLGPEALQFLNLTGLLKKMAVSIGLDPDEVLKGEQQIVQEQQAAQQQALLEQAAGPVSGQVAQALAQQTGEAQ